ncbi:MAG: hypothetical protein K0R40_147 [Burkholderiales bacterium]|jgi:hypothetical protein|nr:hypothetical protein [Burkholderiales bacterium]
MRTIAVVVACIALASLAVLIWAARKVILLERAADPGDVVVLGIFALFAAFCAGMAWLLFRSQPPAARPAASEPEPAPAPRRVTVSRACAAAGVALLILCVLVPETWHPVAFLFAGLALLAVSHALTPCVERLEQLRKARDSMRQL